MSQLPKIKIKYQGSAIEEVYELEEAEYNLNFSGGIITVEGQVVNSCDELIKIVKQDKNRNKEFIEVTLAKQRWSSKFYPC